MDKGVVKDCLTITKQPDQSEKELRSVMGSFEYLLDWTEKLYKALFNEKGNNPFQRNAIEVNLVDKETNRTFVIRVSENCNKEVCLNVGWKNKGTIKREISLEDAQHINSKANMELLETLLYNQSRRVITGEYFKVPEQMQRLERLMKRSSSKEYVHRPQQEIVQTNKNRNIDRKRDNNSR